MHTINLRKLRALSHIMTYDVHIYICMYVACMYVYIYKVVRTSEDQIKIFASFLEHAFLIPLVKNQPYRQGTEEIVSVVGK